MTLVHPILKYASRVWDPHKKGTLTKGTMKNSKIHFDLAQENAQYQRDAGGAQMAHPARPEGSRQNHHAIAKVTSAANRHRRQKTIHFKQTTYPTDYRNYTFFPRTIREWNNSSLSPDQGVRVFHHATVCPLEINP